MNRKRILQSLSKLIVLHVMVLAAFTLPAWIGQFLIPALSPHVAVIGAVAARAVGLAALAAVPMLVVVTLRRRWFCRLLCPMGLIVDSCAKARPGAKSHYRNVPPLGQWLFLATLGGAIVGWPLFLWLDPLSIFTASLNASRWPLDAAAIGAWSAMATLVVMSLIFPKFWCFKLCPLGGMQEMLFDLKLLATKKKEQSPNSLSGVSLGRRSAIFTGLGLAGGLVVALSDRERAQPQLRPPGAVDDTKFKGLCARCGNCVKACPSAIISHDIRLADPAGLMTPIVHYEKGAKKAEDFDKYCQEKCHACTRACPTGAIASLSLAEKLCRPIGLAEVYMPECLLQHGGDCGYCLTCCPQDAISISEIDVFDVRIIIDEGKCNGCGACAVICPVKVINIVPNGRYTIAPVERDSL